MTHGLPQDRALNCAQPALQDGRFVGVAGFALAVGRQRLSLTTDDIKQTDIASALCRLYLRAEDTTFNEDGELDLASAAAMQSSTFFLLEEFANMPLATAMQRATGAPEMSADVALASWRTAIDNAA